MAGPGLPKILHRIWVGPDPMPASAMAHAESWKRLHPDWEMMLWTDANLPQIQNKFIYDGTGILAQKADILRYELLLQFGGIYADVDFDCLQNLEPLLDGVGYFYGEERPGEPAIGLLGSTPGHPFASRCVDRIPEGWPWRTGGILEETGPLFFRRTLLDYAGDAARRPFEDPRTGQVAGDRLEPPDGPPLWALRQWVVYPYYLGETWRPSDHPDAYAVHHWQKSWG